MLKWLTGNSTTKSSKENESEKCGIGLPAPSSPLAGTLNSVVEREYQTSPALSGKKRKRGQYTCYSPESKAKLARYAIEHGNSKAAKHFSSKSGTSINESTIRNFKASYLLKKRQSR
ncbi:hypothetical protein DPMN_118451 [Dreissena polymorpha]|uniref:Uncharacterized protein n=1 Tax=Dreissena polymorpha TaxID=45954 RepID=A0A9D4GK45_DREPO|nr:hypothetical protein DPMN_118451 [Dreissena polymorpha]